MHIYKYVFIVHKKYQFFVHIYKIYTATKPWSNRMKQTFTQMAQTAEKL